MHAVLQFGQHSAHHASAILSCAAVQADEEVDGPDLQADSQLTQLRLSQQYSAAPKGGSRRHSSHVPLAAGGTNQAFGAPVVRTTNAFGPPAARTRCALLVKAACGAEFIM